jgi:hypothetical protein
MEFLFGFDLLLSLIIFAVGIHYLRCRLYGRCFSGEE